MNNSLVLCRQWIEDAYSKSIGTISDNEVELRWVSAEDLTKETSAENGGAVALTDPGIGWLFYFLPYSLSKKIDSWVNQALGLRARAARESNYTGQTAPAADEDHSSWQVGLIWLVDADDKAAWQNEIAVLRHDSGASEELSFDCVDIVGSDVHAALERHGLPRLLLSSRHLLQKQADEAERWLSADAQVIGKLSGFSTKFPDSLARTHARWLEDQASATPTSTSAMLAASQHRFSGFSVSNFRNLDSLEIAAPSNDVEAIVLFGPNGTGKSSLIEALCLAAFNRSRRSDAYLVDKDESARNGTNFSSRYIDRIDGANPAKYCWGCESDMAFDVQDADKAKDPNGVILDQDQSREFASMQADELAEKVLRGYSDIAQRLSDELDRKSEAAKQAKLSFFRQYDLNSGITKSETAYDRLAKTVLEQVKPVPSGFSDWANRVAQTAHPEAATARELGGRWKLFHDLPASLGNTLAKLESLGADTGIARAIEEALVQYNDLADETRALLDQWEKRYTQVKDNEAELLSQLDAWGEFLSRPAAAGAATAEAAQLAQEQGNVALRRKDLERHGREVAARLELLERSHAYLEEHWSQDHSDTCPVCASNIADPSGILSVVQALESECRRDRDDARVRYAQLGKRQQEIESQLKGLSAGVCPLSSEHQGRLREVFAPFLAGSSLESVLTDRARREQLKADLQQATRLLPKPERYPDTASESQRLANEFKKLCEQTDIVLAEPQALEEVRKAYQGILRNVLEQHLPETLGKVWREIAHCLTAAHWLLPDTPTMKLEQGRGRQGHRLALKVGKSDRLARYIFNAAELHTMGLAWFFTLHLCRRRFSYNWIALDDPAQDLDQTSFREFTRFLATWQRLYRHANQHHALIIALHQEERALDTTRATDAQLYLLGWNARQSESGPASPGVRRQVLLSPGYHPKKPSTFFRQPTPITSSN